MNRAEAEERARRALGLSETSLGASAGTDAMRIAAQRSLLKSNTSYRRQWVQDPTTGQWQNQEMDFAQMSRTMYGDVAELVQDGLITVADGASMIKSNTARMDRAGVGFGTTMAQLEVAAGNAAGVGGVRGVGGMNIEGMLDDVMSGTGSGQMLGQRHETVRMLAPEMLRRAQAAAARDYTPDDGFGPQRQLGREFIEQVAMAAGRIDLAGQLPELNAALNANSYIGAQIEPNGPTVGQWVEFFRTGQQSAGGQQIYQNLVDGHAVRIAAQNGLPQNHPTVQARARQETDQQIADAQRVFQEYRREYGAAWQGQPQGQNVP